LTWRLTSDRSSEDLISDASLSTIYYYILHDTHTTPPPCPPHARPLFKSFCNNSISVEFAASSLFSFWYNMLVKFGFELFLYRTNAPQPRLNCPMIPLRNRLSRINIILSTNSETKLIKIYSIRTHNRNQWNRKIYTLITVKVLRIKGIEETS
jgi:hypothetical protein